MKFQLNLKFNDGRNLNLGIFDGDSLGSAIEKCRKKYRTMFSKLVCNAHTIEGKFIGENNAK